MYNLTATIGKITAILIIFIVFYCLLHLGGDVGLAIVLALLAATLVEIKVIVYKLGEKK